MRTLLLIAHGSRRQASNDEIRELASKMNAMDTGFDQVDCAFLELAEPSIPDGVRQSIENGSSEVVLLPYFLSAGRHVVEDAPAEVAIVQQEHPEVNITITPYLGCSESMIKLILELANSAKN